MPATAGSAVKRTRRRSVKRPRDKTVRIDGWTNATLDRLARKRGEAKKALLARAVDRMRRDEMLDSLNAGYAAVRANAAAWREEAEELALWDSTLADGLTDE